MPRLRPLAISVALAALSAVTVLAGSALASSGSHSQNTLLIRAGLGHREVMPALLPNSKENTSVIVQNDGSAPATIAMDVYTPAGVLIPSASKIETNVPPGGTRTFAQAINTGLTPGFRGVGVLSSDQPINALLVRDIEENNSGRKAYSVHNAYGSGGNKVALPYIANNAGGVYQTRFAIANTGTATACVSIAYAFDGGGNANDAPTGQGGCSTGYAVPVGGQVAFGPATVAAEATTAMPSATAGKIMSATVTSTGAQVTVAVDAYVTSSERKLASYDGFISGDAASTTDDLGTSIAMPLALKLGGFYTQYLFANPNATAATLTIKYVGSTGTYDVPLTVPANGTNSHGVYSTGSPVPEGFVGAATITSTQPIAAVMFRAKMTSAGSYVDEDLYTAVNGIPADRAGKTAKFPLIFRRIGAGGGLSGYNTWVSVAVADGSTANVTITTVTDQTSSAGCSAANSYTATKAVTGSFVFYQNLDTVSENGLNANPTCLWGGMTIASDKPIIAIANVTNDIFPGDNDGLYNGFISN